MVISIVIPIHNRLEVTKQGLTFLEKALSFRSLDSNKFNYEIIVVDDGSNDGSGDWIKQNCPNVNLITGDGNLWWSECINRGVKYALVNLNTDFVLLWNDDIIPDKTYFIELNKIINKIDDNTICGSLIYQGEKKNKIWFAGGVFNKWTGKKFMKNYIDNTTNNKLKCDWITGMGTLISNKIITKHKLNWDNNMFPQYYGDSDFTLRAKKKGVNILVDKRLIIYNRTEYTGNGKATNLKSFWSSITSIRSFLGFKYTHRFYLRHGVFPFFYLGLLKLYTIHFLSFINKYLRTLIR
jgi:GT2 family glycosyltransferase